VELCTGQYVLGLRFLAGDYWNHWLPEKSQILPKTPAVTPLGKNECSTSECSTTGYTLPSWNKWDFFTSEGYPFFTTEASSDPRAITS